MIRQRGTILLGVLVVVTIAALTGASAMFAARAQVASASLTVRRSQARAMAWSGIQAAMAELADQREDLLDGVEPRLTEEWELFEEHGSRAVIRLVAADGDPEGGGDGLSQRATSEAGRLNINTATVEMLTKLGLEQSLAEGIVAGGQEQPYSSVEELLTVPGFTAAVLRGSGAGSEEGEEFAESPPLMDLLTVWSFDPSTQSGIGDDASQHRGKLRVNLNMEWSDRLGTAIDERFGEGSSAIVKGLIDKGSSFKSMADLVTALQSLKLEPEEWPTVFDAFTMNPDPYLPGKVDLLRAPASVLACIPGIDEAAAGQIVEVRQSLAGELKRSIVWPVTEGILTAEQFAQAADYLTTRSMQWRILIEAGIAAPSERFSEAGAEPLRNRILLEAVIDVASERPRVAYLRDITMRRAADSLYQSLLGGEEDAEMEEADLLDLLPPTIEESGPERGFALRGDENEETEIGAGIRLPGLRPRAARGSRGSAAASPESPSPDTSGFGALDMGGLELGGMDLGFPDDAESAAGPSSAEPPESGSGSAPAGIDRRIGRWTSGPAKGGAP